MAFKPVHHQNHLHSFTFCKYPSLLSSNFYKFSNGFSKNHSKISNFSQIQSQITTHSEKESQESSKPTVSRRILDKIQHGFSSFESKNENFKKKTVEIGKIHHGYSSFESKDEKDEKFKKKDSRFDVLEEKISKSSKNIDLDVKRGRKAKKGKLDSPVIILKIGLEICSKLGHVMGAIGIFDLAKREGITLGQYHYAIILYLCSSAAVGLVQPAKSGRLDMNSNHNSGNHNSGNFNEHTMELEPVFQTLDGLVSLINDNENSFVKNVIKVGDNVKEYALKRGFEIYQEMLSNEVPMNEAILTSLARMAMSKKDGEMAFEMVKKMKDLGINPRLRSYNPALSVFCESGNVEKAFEIEEHMLAHGVIPEEPELELLLRVSIEANRSDKVYYLLHKLRTGVRKVLPSTANVIERWFKSKTASRIGKRKWDESLVNKAVENGGGGWHGLGWIGNGKWNVMRSFVGKNGLCKCCGEKLATIDLDPVETEKFAESVAKIAKERDRNLNFEKFQKWLDYYGPFEAIVDGANVGLFSQRRFKPSKASLAGWVMGQNESKRFIYFLHPFDPFPSFGNIYLPKGLFDKT